MSNESWTEQSNEAIRVFVRCNFNDNNCTDNTVSGNLAGERSRASLHDLSVRKLTISYGPIDAARAFGKKRVLDGSL